MKTLLTIAALFFTLQLSAQQQDSVYCIQLLSTRNPELLKPEMVSTFQETCKVEQYGEWYRILYLCENYDEAVIFLHSWKRQHKNAFIVKKSTIEIQKMYNLFTYD